MAIITMPQALRVGGFAFGQRRFDLIAVSDPAGTQQARLFGPPRWVCSIQSPRALPRADAVVWQTMLLQLRGRVNHLAVWDRTSPVPVGSMRGSITVSSTIAAGATTGTLTAGAGQASTTLRAGDKLQIGTGVGTSQLVQITADAQANGSGVITVSFEPPARISFAGGTAVTWDKPLAYCKAQADESTWQAVAPELWGGYGIDLMEQFA